MQSRNIRQRVKDVKLEEIKKSVNLELLELNCKKVAGGNELKKLIRRLDGVSRPKPSSSDSQTQSMNIADSCLLRIWGRHVTQTRTSSRRRARRSRRKLRSSCSSVSTFSDSHGRGISAMLQKWLVRIPLV